MSMIRLRSTSDPAERAGVELPKEQYSKEAKERSDLRETLLAINKLAAKYYYAQLRSEKGRQAIRYLTDRSLTEETIVHFGLGYANKYSDDLSRYLKMQGYSDELIVKSGLQAWMRNRESMTSSGTGSCSRLWMSIVV